MIPVKQKKYKYPGGDCFKACIASILELPLEAVPDFINAVQKDEQHWWIPLHEWLGQFNMGMVCIDPGESSGYEDVKFEGIYAIPYVPGYAIVGAQSSNFGKVGGFHAVVYKDGKFVFDPAPDDIRKPVGKHVNYYLFTSLDPARVVDAFISGKMKNEREQSLSEINKRMLEL